jgi:predicted PurR-regulated permease PerM
MKPAVSSVRIASWIIAGITLFLVVVLHLLPALIAGLLVYELVHLLAPKLSRVLRGYAAKQAALLLLSVIVIGAIVFIVLALLALFRGEGGGMVAVAKQLAVIADEMRSSMPAWTLQYLPENADAWMTSITRWLRDHVRDLQNIGTMASRAFAHIIIGLVIGAILAMRVEMRQVDLGPLGLELVARAQRLAESFRRIVFAQVRISAINTTFTAIYLAIVLPAAGIELPLLKTMIAVTFIAGLLPVIGNLISNTVIVAVSLTHSFQVAMFSLVYLVVIHKLEYFLNARIVGGRISARAWELLIAMIAMEAAFGLGGLVAAPIYYAYLKDELRTAKMI